MKISHEQSRRNAARRRRRVAGRHALAGHWGQQARPTFRAGPVGADLRPDPSTAGDFCRRFAEADVSALLQAINAVRPKLWAGRGRVLLGPIAYLDVDGTIASTTAGQRKQGMDMSYKGIWGYAPLIVSLANTREVLYLVNRPGNAPSHQNAVEWIDKAIDLVAPHTPRVCLRGDTDFSLTGHFDR